MDSFFIYPDAQFQQWWEDELGRNPIQEGHVIPVLKAHPKSSCLWDKHISGMLTKELGFKATIHEPCLFYKRNNDGDITPILWQVETFLVANNSSKK